jgi:hypothetical protein
MRAGYFVGETLRYNGSLSILSDTANLFAVMVSMDRPPLMVFIVKGACGDKTFSAMVADYTEELARKTGEVLFRTKYQRFSVVEVKHIDGLISMEYMSRFLEDIA